MRGKYKEIGKTVILCLLLVSTFVLAAQLWIFEELYKVTDISDVVRLLTRQGMYVPFSSQEVRGSKWMDEVFTPLQMVATYEDDRSFIRFEKEALPVYYAQMRNLISDYLARSGGMWTATANMSVWREGMRENSMLFNFEQPLSLQILCQYLEMPYPEGAETMQACCGMILADPEPGDIKVLFKDENAQMVYIFQSGYVEEVEAFIEEAAKDTEQMKGAFFAFEDEETHQAVVQAGISPETVFFTKPARQPVIVASNPLNADAAGKTAAEENVLEIFLFDASSVRKYAALDGGLLFVENFSTLRLGADGLVEYHVTQNDRGIAVFSASATEAALLSRYDMVQGACRLLSAMGPEVFGGQAGLVYGGMEYFSETGTYRLYFDYSFQNYAIQMPENTQNKGYPISIDIAGGYITGASILLRTFSADGTATYQQPKGLMLNILRHGDYAFSLTKFGEKYVYEEENKPMRVQYYVQA